MNVRGRKRGSSSGRRRRIRFVINHYERGGRRLCRRCCAATVVARSRETSEADDNIDDSRTAGGQRYGNNGTGAERGTHACTTIARRNGRPGFWEAHARAHTRDTERRERGSDVNVATVGRWYRANGIRRDRSDGRELDALTRRQKKRRRRRYTRNGEKRTKIF